jgi:hypothetical protein
MSKINNFDEIWRQKTDEQLFEALAHKDDYDPESIESVRREIAGRNLDSQRITELETQTQKALEDEGTIAQIPLQWPLRILSFLLSFGIYQIIVGEYYRNKGYKRKYQEIWKWMAYGFVFWLEIFVLRKVL